MPPLPAPETWPLIRAQVAKMLPNPKRQATLALFDDLLGRDTAVLKYLESKRNPDADPLKEDVFSPEHTISDAELPIALRAGDLKLLAIWKGKSGSDPPKTVGRIKPLDRQFKWTRDASPCSNA